MGILHHYHLTRGSTLSSQDCNPRSMVYVPEQIRAIQRHFASLETQSVVMTSSEYLKNRDRGPFTESLAHICISNDVQTEMMRPT
jgi:hypothetical protein